MKKKIAKRLKGMVPAPAERPGVAAHNATIRKNIEAEKERTGFNKKFGKKKATPSIDQFIAEEKRRAAEQDKIIADLRQDLQQQRDQYEALLERHKILLGHMRPHPAKPTIPDDLRRQYDELFRSMPPAPPMTWVWCYGLTNITSPE